MDADRLCLSISKSMRMKDLFGNISEIIYDVSRK